MSNSTIASASLLFLLSSLFPAGGVAAVEPPVSLGVPYSIGDPSPARVPQKQAVVASNGEQALLVWLDFRAGLGSEVWGARVDRNGELLDPHGFLIQRGSGSYYTNAEPAVAWADGVYLVAWEREWLDIVGVRVSPDGTVLDQQPLMFREGGSGDRPHLTSDGSQFLLTSPGSPMTMRIIDSSGAVTAAPDHELFDSVNTPFFASASDGDGYLVVTRLPQTSKEVLFHVSTGGDVAVTEIDLTDQLLWVDLVWDGSSYLLVAASSWSGNPAVNAGLYLATLSRDGSIMEQDWITPPDEVKATAPSAIVAPDGSVLIAWIARSMVHTSGEAGEARLIRLEPSGTVTHRTIDGSSPKVRLELLDGRPLLVWGPDRWHGASGSWFGVVDGSLGFSSEPASVTTSAVVQNAPDVARSETAIGYVWEEWPAAGPHRIAFGIGAIARLAAVAGEVLFPSNGWQEHPAIASDGRDFLVVWQEHGSESTEVFAMRVSGTGERLDAEPMNLTHGRVGGTDPVVAWNGRFYIVGFPRVGGITYVRVTREGVVLDDSGTSLVTSPRDGHPYHPSLASTRGTSLLVWQDGTQPVECSITCFPEVPGRILAIRIDQDGNRLDPEVMEISPGIDYELTPAVASKDGEFMVVWRTTRGISAARVTTEGAVHRHEEQEPLIPLAPNLLVRPTVAPASDGWLLAWEQVQGETERAVAAVLLDSEGKVQQPLLLLAGEALPERMPVLLSLSRQLTLLLYIQPTPLDSPWHGAIRLFGKSVAHEAETPTNSPRRRVTRGN